MMVRDYAYILDGVVVNVCRSTADNVALYPFPYDMAVDVTDLEPRPGPRWRYVDGDWSEPPSEPPPEPEPAAPSNAIAGTAYAVSPSDDGRTLATVSAATVTVTVPASLPAGFRATFVQQGGGRIQFVAGPGASVQSSSGYRTAGRWSSVSVLGIGGGTSVLSGDLAV